MSPELECRTTDFPIANQGEFAELTSSHQQIREVELSRLENQISELEQGIPQIIDARQLLNRMEIQEESKRIPLSALCLKECREGDRLLGEQYHIQVEILAQKEMLIKHIEFGLKSSYIKINDIEHLGFIERLIDGTVLQYIQHKPLAEPEAQAFKAIGMTEYGAKFAIYAAPVCSYLNSLEALSA